MTEFSFLHFDFFVSFRFLNVIEMINSLSIYIRGKMMIDWNMIDQWWCNTTKTLDIIDTIDISVSLSILKKWISSSSSFIIYWFENWISKTKKKQKNFLEKQFPLTTLWMRFFFVLNFVFLFLFWLIVKNNNNNNNSWLSKNNDDDDDNWKRFFCFLKKKFCLKKTPIHPS